MLISIDKDLLILFVLFILDLSVFPVGEGERL